MYLIDPPLHQYHLGRHWTLGWNIWVTSMLTKPLDPNDYGLKHLLYLTYSHGLKNHISEFAWKTPSRVSCLDLTFTNLEFPIFCEVLTDISDHLMIAGSFDIEVFGCQHSVLSTCRCFRDFDVAKFVFRLQQA